MLRGMEEAVRSTRLRRFVYQPALDGVRGVAVAMVLLFHHGWLGGGYVGVSVFFTLSGYLITALALEEHERTGGFDVKAFYGRRVRRLLPASLACLAGILALASLGLFEGVEHLRRDLLGALAQVYNWVALDSGQTYADLVGGDGALSPVEHYWSLAIEEQFYWVWPLVLLAVLRRGRDWRLVVVGALTVVAGVSAPLIAGVWGGDAAYWAAPARLAEILVGALVAVVLHGRRRDRSLPPAMAWFGVVGAGVVIWAAVTWPSGSGPAYAGWLPAFAVASAAVIVGLQVPSPLRRSLTVSPLVLLGTVSYGVYLIHWPVYVVLDAERTGLGTVPLFVVRVAVTLALAALSFRSLERPIRTGRLQRPTGGLTAVAACAAIALMVVVVPVDTTPYWRSSDAEAGAGALAPTDSVGDLRPLRPLRAIGPSIAAPTPTVAPTTPPTTSTVPATTTSVGATVPATTPTTVAPTTVAPTTAAPTTSSVPPVPVVPPLPTELSRPVRILIVGDSTAWATGDGIVAWAADHPDVARAAVTASVGTGFIRDGIVVADEDDTFLRNGHKFRDRLIPEAMARLHPDVVVGMVTLRDIDDRTWDEAEGALGPADDRFLARLIADYDTATQQFLDAGATDVLWVLGPMPVVGDPNLTSPLLEPVRYQRYAAALAEVAAHHPGTAVVVDLASWLAVQPVPPERPDGLHFSDDGAEAVARDFLGPIAVAAALS